MNPKEVTRKSKFLSLVLRHDPGSVGIKLDSAGWTEVEGLLAAVKFTREDLDTVVHENGKKRFEFSEDVLRIRASQGHSVEVDLAYEPQTPPDELYHGTGADLLPTLREQGLLKMSRHHVHLSPDIETARIVAKRRKNPVILRIASVAMHQQGMTFYRSTNGVWLTEHVPPAYLTEL